MGRLRPTVAIDLLAMGLVLVLYVGLGLVWKGAVLNWIVGPLFPFVVLYVVPASMRRVRGRGADGAA